MGIQKWEKFCRRETFCSWSWDNDGMYDLVVGSLKRGNMKTMLEHVVNKSLDEVCITSMARWNLGSYPRYIRDKFGNGKRD